MPSGVVVAGTSLPPINCLPAHTCVIAELLRIPEHGTAERSARDMQARAASPSRNSQFDHFADLVGLFLPMVCP